MSQRLWLLIVWLSGFVLGLAALIVFLMKGWMLSDNFMSNFGVITGISAPQITPILTFWFVKKRTAELAAEEAPKDAFIVALLTSVIYNLVVLFIISTVFFATGENLIEERLQLARSVSTAMIFLVGPAVGYFFAKG